MTVERWVSRVPRMPMRRDHLIITRVRPANARCDGVLSLRRGSVTRAAHATVVAHGVTTTTPVSQVLPTLTNRSTATCRKARDSRDTPRGGPRAGPRAGPGALPRASAVGQAPGQGPGHPSGLGMGHAQGQERSLMRPSWAIHTGDALGLLAGLPSDHVAAVITDPPYSSGGAVRQRTAHGVFPARGSHAVRAHRADFAGDNRDQRAYGYWSALWLAEALRVTRPGGVCLVFADWRQLPVTTDALQAGGWVWRGIVPWDKTESARPDKGRFRTQCEYVVWGSKGPLRVAPPVAPCLPGVVRERVCRRDKHHIAGKPTAVMRHLVRIAWQGGIVLDPFCGSGTTGVAAIEVGLDFIGCEAVAAYAEVARSRCAHAATQRAKNPTTASNATNPPLAINATNPTTPTPTTSPSDAGLWR